MSSLRWRDADEGKPAVRTPGESVALLQQWLRALLLPRTLSRREVEIVSAAVHGLDTKATAAQMGVSPKTVDEYWRRVYRKLRCNSRIEVLARLLLSVARQSEQRGVIRVVGPGARAT